MAYEKEIQVAIAATTIAAKLCQRVRQAQDSQTLQKPDTSPVTVADFSTQAAICQALAAAFPGDPIVAEESASMLQQPERAESLAQVISYVREFVADASESDIIDWINLGNGEVASRYWMLDPIDGTKGYIRGDQYAIALALVEDGKLQLGVMACPALPLNFAQADSETGTLFIAVRGEGTKMMALGSSDFQFVRVNQSDDIAQSRPIESIVSTHSNRPIHRQIASRIGLTQPTVQMDSQAKYGAVARGEADLYMRVPRSASTPHKENIWDHGPGAIVVEEAGGRVTDLDGKPLDFSVGPKLSNNRGIVASNGAIHDRVLAAWQSVSAEMG